MSAGKHTVSWNCKRSERTHRAGCALLGCKKIYDCRELCWGTPAVRCRGTGGGVKGGETRESDIQFGVFVVLVIQIEGFVH